MHCRRGSGSPRPCGSVPLLLLCSSCSESSRQLVGLLLTYGYHVCMEEIIVQLCRKAQRSSLVLTAWAAAAWGCCGVGCCCCWQCRRVGHDPEGTCGLKLCGYRSQSAFRGVRRRLRDPSCGCLDAHAAISQGRFCPKGCHCQGVVALCALRVAVCQPVGLGHACCVPACGAVSVMNACILNVCRGRC